jgi:hypothetical protein
MKKPIGSAIARPTEWMIYAEALEKENKKLRATLRWSFSQLRDWWRGTNRNMSNPDSAIKELDRMEKAVLGE